MSTPKQATTTKVEGIDPEKWYTLNELVRLTGLSRVYLHRSCTKLATLESRYVAINGKGQYRHEIQGKVFIAWRRSRKGGFARKDGRNKFTAYASPKEQAIVKELIASDPRLKGVEFFRTNKASK